MAGSFPDPPDYRMAYDNDGTVGRAFSRLLYLGNLVLEFADTNPDTIIRAADDFEVCLGLYRQSFELQPDF